MSKRTYKVFPINEIQFRNTEQGRYKDNAAKLKEVKDAGGKCATCIHRQQKKLSHWCKLRRKWTQLLYICEKHQLENTVGILNGNT